MRTPEHFMAQEKYAGGEFAAPDVFYFSLETPDAPLVEKLTKVNDVLGEFGLWYRHEDGSEITPCTMLG